MANFFDLQRKTTAPTGGAIVVADYYKDNTTPIQLSVTGASFMKVWINQNATGSISDPEFPAAWVVNATSWTPNFSVEGTNYVHALFSDDVGNYVDVDGNPIIVNSTSTIYDKTVPSVTDVTIAGGADIVATQNVTVRVTATDAKTGVSAVSDINYSTLSGDLDSTSETSFIWSDTDRTNGYKDCSVKLKANAGSSSKETKTVYATATDRAGNTSERNSDNIILYSGGIDPVIVVKDKDGAIIKNHYGDTKISITLSILTGDPTLIAGVKVWGDFGTTEGGTTPTPQPTTWEAWGSTEPTKVYSDRYLTASDGDKDVEAAVRLNVASIAGTVATKADLPATADAGAIYEVTADESKAGENDFYQYLAAASKWVYYGKKVVDGTDTYAEHDLEKVSIHHSEAVPSIVLAASKDIISDKSTFDNTDLTATFTTSCNVSDYKIVAYATAEAAQAGTYADASNVGMTGTEEKASGSTWTQNLTETVLISAIAGEGAKFLVCYAKNLCGKWGKSNIQTVTIDLTPPVGNIVVDAYYNAPSGFTASATDANTVSKMTAWVDNTAANETIPAEATEVDYMVNPTVDKIYWAGANESSTTYAHIKYVDSVGNFSFAHSVAFCYDKTAPTDVTLTVPALTNTTTITGTLSATDTVSGVKDYIVWGDVDGAATEGAAAWQTYAETINITLTSGDGTKTINVKVRDKAGNASTTVTKTTELDTTKPTGTLVLYKADGSEVLPAVVNTTAFAARVGSTEAAANIKEYKIYGDVQGKTTEEGASWLPFTPDAGQTYMTVTGLDLTTGDGVKSVKLKIKDQAGNISTEVPQSVTLDSSVPVITISGLDYSIISDKTTTRLTFSGTPITGTRCDKVTFKFSSNQKLMAFKVCVYDDTKTAAEAVAITMTGGSVGMSGGETAANTEVPCTLMDEDFKAHPKVNSVDGAYKVIVYGKNVAGSWSSSAPITPAM